MREPLLARSLLQLVDGLTAEPAPAPRLRVLAVSYYEPSSSVSRAELDVLRRLPQLQTLEVMPWGGPSDFPGLGGAALVSKEI